MYWSFNAPKFNVATAAELETATLETPSQAAAANSLILALRAHIPIKARAADGGSVENVEAEWLNALNVVDAGLAETLEAVIRSSNAAKYVATE